MNTDEFEGHSMDGEHQLWCWSKDAERHMTMPQMRATAALLNAAPDLLAEVKKLRYIVDSIPDEVWEDMKTWEAMKGVIE